jgi:hypothetical protein
VEGTAVKDLREISSTDDGPTQPVAHLALSPTDLEQRFGMRFHRERDDFDELDFAVVELAGYRFLFSRYIHNPEPGTTVASFDAGDPVRQAAALARALDLENEVTEFWDGSRWQHGPLQATAR